MTPYLLPWWPIVACYLGLWIFGSGWTAILLYHAGIALSLAIHPEAAQTVKRGFKPLWALGVSVACLATLPAVRFGLPFLLQVPPGEVADQLGKIIPEALLGNREFLLFALYFLTIHPLLEEIGWRELLRVDAPGLHLRDMQFAVYHLVVIFYFFPAGWVAALISIITLICASWFWRQFRRFSGGLAVPVLSHIAADAGILMGAMMFFR